jgi:hypothetical protein
VDRRVRRHRLVEGHRHPRAPGLPHDPGEGAHAGSGGRRDVLRREPAGGRRPSRWRVGRRSAADQFAWNQYGVKYELTTENTFRKIAPAVVGSHLRFGSIAVTKKITGPAAQYAPTSFLADVVCSAGGSALDLERRRPSPSVRPTTTRRASTASRSAPRARRAPSPNRAPSARSVNLRSGSPTTIAVTEAAPQDGAAGDAALPQVATLTNDYQYSGLSVTKQVQTEATAGEFGPFTFSLTCTSATGMPVAFDAGFPRAHLHARGGSDVDRPSHPRPGEAAR